MVRAAVHLTEGAKYAVKVVENKSLEDEENLEALETEVCARGGGMRARVWRDAYACCGRSAAVPGRGVRHGWALPLTAMRRSRACVHRLTS